MYSINRLQSGACYIKIFEMSLKESFVNIIKPNGRGGMEEFTDLNKALEQENLVSVAFLKGEISLEDYHRFFEETHPLTKTDFRGLATVSDKRR